MLAADEYGNQSAPQQRYAYDAQQLSPQPDETGYDDAEPAQTGYDRNSAVAQRYQPEAAGYDEDPEPV